MLTNREILQEFKGLMDHILRTIWNFDKTQEGFVPFKLFPDKKRLYVLRKHRFNLVTKNRSWSIDNNSC
jgi:hypothetical protein